MQQTWLTETQRAFDSVAADYDGPRGNNALIQRMRGTMWRTLETTFAPGARLLDLGCGTGLDAAYLARRGYHVLATDWSPEMVARTEARALAAGLTARLTARQIGAQELEKLVGERFDGAYSNFGPLNCAPDLAAVAQNCAALVRPGGALVLSVIGRHCPWEFVHYTRLGRHARARVRYRRDAVPVGMNQQTIWAWYYTPQEFYAPFAADFALTSYRGLSLFLPPPYLIDWYERHIGLGRALGGLDDALGGWPLLRDAGDHFLIVMTRR